MESSNRLKPALSRRTLRCIGSTTYKEFRNHFDKDLALLLRFQKIDVNEPTIEDTVKILKGLRTAFEEHHNVKYTPDALKTAVELSARYINDRRLPDKAIDLIDFDYGPNNSYWHTHADTADKCSAESLQALGEVVLRVTYGLQ